MAVSLWLAPDEADTVAVTDFDFFRTFAVFTVFALLPVFDEMELTTTRQDALAHAAAVTRSVSSAAFPDFFRETFAAVFEFTLKVAGATPAAALRTPDEVTPAANVMSGIVTNQPSVPWASAVHLVQVGVPWEPPSVRASENAASVNSGVAATAGVAPKKLRMAASLRTALIVALLGVPSLHVSGAEIP
jgi:hypothetical protein